MKLINTKNRTKEYRIEMFNKLATDYGMTNNNYSMITFTYLTSSNKIQLKKCIKELNNLNFKYISVIEFSDEQSKGYHLHIITKKTNLSFIPPSTNYHLSTNLNLSYAIEYICKDNNSYYYTTDEVLNGFKITLNNLSIDKHFNSLSTSAQQSIKETLLIFSK